ncbi:MAG: epoxyqueuosine reductase [Abditibacteriota bacterium]|nr:epoxyqueuosine reductase [Abditibacteriota bacterium]
MSQSFVEELKSGIKAQAAKLGFAACGITGVEASQTHGHFRQWIENGFQAKMQWIAREEAVAKRADLQRVLPGVQSVVCVAMHYRTDQDDAAWDQSTLGGVAKYARGIDYHETMTERLRELQSWITAQCGEHNVPCQGRAYVDTGPILERELARRAGLGWVGKNTMLLSRELGSYFLLGEVLLTIELPPDRPHIEQFCGSCTRCLDACPTQAFVAPYVLDANKCISFHTIENRERAPEGLREKFGDWVFGCDVCQDVCPWNGKSTFESAEPQLWQREEFPTLLEWLMLPQAEFSRRLSKSPLKRAKRRGLKRNAVNALKNRRRREAKS